jgi:hypothetical protein
VSTKPTIKVGDIVRDIRSGMSDSELMEKYKLSSAGLQSIFGKLVNAKAMRKSELYSRSLLYADTVTIQDLRKLPRNQLVDWISIEDISFPGTKYEVQDITEQGLQIADIKAEVDEIRSFLIPADEAGGGAPIEFEGRCRWIQRDKDKGRYTAGFEITKISEGALQELREMIKLFSTKD